MALNILGIDTSSSVCSIGILCDDEVVFEAAIHRKRSHAEHLIILIEHGLSHADLCPEQIDLVSVSMGPGSYTGLRIGTSTAKGLAYAADAAFVGVSSLEALAVSVRQYIQPDDRIIPTLDARRDEVYTALYRNSDSDWLEELIPASKMSVKELESFEFDRGITHHWFVGEGAEKCFAASQRPGRAVGILGPVRSIGVSVARLGLRQLEAGNLDDMITFEPSYLNAFQVRKESSVFERLPK